MGNPYPADVLREDGSVDRDGFVTFTDPSNQPGPGPNPITSGALTAQAITTATAFQPSTTRGVTVAIAASFDAASTDATMKVELSPDDTTFTTLATVTVPHATQPVNGLVELYTLPVPMGWWVKVTLTNVTVSAVKY